MKTKYCFWLFALGGGYLSWGQDLPPAQIRSIRLDDVYSNTLGGSAASDSWAYYRLDLSTFQKPKSGDWDLVLEVENNGFEWTDPNLFVNFNETLPTLMTAQLKCAFYGEDFCVISSKELEGISVITMGVSCYQQCHFNLQAQVTEELLLDTGRSYKLFFKADQERIVRFEIPNDINITTVEIKGINQNKFDPFNMIMTKGNTLPNSENALYLRPAWENGYVGKFTSDCQCFCRGCNYTVLITAEQDGFITVGAKVSGQVIDLMRNQVNPDTTAVETYDSVLYYHSQCYKYLVTKKDKDLRVKLESFSGDPNIFVNPAEVPQNLWLSKFNSRDHFENEELVVTPAERTAANATTGEYYICIFGNTAATFKLTVDNSDHDVFLKSGISESGYIDANETQLYYFRDPILAVPNVTISMSLHVMTGKARLRAKLCPVKSTAKYEDYVKECTFSQEDMLKGDTEEREEAHLGEESDKTDPEMCQMPSGKDARSAQVSCVFVVGIIGLAPFQTHFSVMLKFNQEAHHTVMKEGVPIQGELPEATPQYYLATINNPNVTRVTFQLTTIHGDPDIFISKTSKTPSPTDFEKRSIRCGIYPEMVEYNVEQNKTLEGTYYITVFGYVQSTFALTYFTQETYGDGATQPAPIIKLNSGQRQKGVLRSARDSLMYFFKLSTDMKEDLTIRLSSENGHFKMYMNLNSPAKPGAFHSQGDESKPIVVNMTSFEAKNNTVNAFYVLVVPVQYAIQSENQIYDSSGMSYQYTIAFYEGSQTMRLVDGLRADGEVTVGNYDYFSFDIGKDLENFSYEIAVTPKTGNPDLVLSLNSSNTFPDLETYDYISESQFSTDSIIVDSKVVKEYMKKVQKGGKNRARKVRTVYIGVYTKVDTTCTFSVMVTKKHVFSPILMLNGQSQAGVVESKETKYFYFKTSSYTPLYVSLTPQSGNPNLQLWILSNLSAPISSWEQSAQSILPDYVSKESFDSDIVALETKDTKYREKCGSSCIILISVDGNSTTSSSHYSLQVTRDMVELQENLRISGAVSELNNYRFYRYYKACKEICDLHIAVEPQQMYGDLQLLVMNDLGNGSLPTIAKYAKWKLKVNALVSLQIETTDLLKQTILPGEDQNTFLIGIYSKTNASYFIKISILPRISSQNLASRDYLGLKKLQAGEVLEVSLLSRETKYFFYENWGPSPIKFRFESADSNQPEIKMIMNVTSLESNQYLPSNPFELLNANWITNEWQPRMYADSINFATPRIECYYIIKLVNMRNSDTTKVRLTVMQEDEMGRGFTGHMVIGKPISLKLAAKEKAALSFKFVKANQKVTINAQYFNGNAYLKLQVEENKVFDFQQYSEEQRKKFDFSALQTLSSSQFTFGSGLELDLSYIVQVEALSDLHASFLLSTNDSLSLVPDGIPLHFTAKDQVEVRYFTYIPPSSHFQLAVHSKALQLDGLYHIAFKRFASSSLQHRLLRTLNTDSDTYLPQFSLTHPIRKSAPWWTGQLSKEYNDYVIFSSSAKVGRATRESYNFLPITMEKDQDMILIKVTVERGDTNTTNSTTGKDDQVEFEVTISGSEIQYLQVGATVRGHVSNFNDTYKIYQIYINKDQLKREEGSDLYIEVTPCNGRVTMFVSDAYEALFNKDKQAGFIDLVNQYKFGRLTSMVQNVGQFSVIYVGITSTNEHFMGLQEQLDSYFEVKTQFVKAGAKVRTESFMLKEGVQDIDLIWGRGPPPAPTDTVTRPHSPDPEGVIIRWGQIYKTDKKQKGLIGSPYQPVEEKRISYQIYAATTDQAVQSLNSLCSIEHAPANSLFAIYFSSEEERDREVRISRQDLKNVKALGVIAQISDQETRQMITLAYEPYIIQKHETFGVRLGAFQVIMLIAFGLTSLFCLGTLVYCLRRKHIFLSNKLDNVISYQEQQSEFADVTMHHPSKLSTSSSSDRS